MKKLLLMILVVSMVFGCAFANTQVLAESEFRLYISPASATVTPSIESITVSIIIENNPGIWSAGFHLVYSDELSIVGSDGNVGKCGNVFSKSEYNSGRVNVPLNDDNITNGMKKIIAAEGIDPQGKCSTSFVFLNDSINDNNTSNGTLLTVEFVLPENFKNNSVYEIGLYSAEGEIFSADVGSDKRIPVFTDIVPNMQGCTLQFVCDHASVHTESQSSTCTNKGYEKTVCDICGDTVSVTYLPLAAHTFGEDGLCTVCKMPSDAESGELGDINGDAVINAKDVNSMRKFLAGVGGLSDAQLVCADINKDGMVNATDMNLISRYVAGIISSF